jgi:hypothetical protein
MDTMENQDKSKFLDHLPGRESDHSEFIIRGWKFPGCNPRTLRCSVLYQDMYCRRGV